MEANTLDEAKLEAARRRSVSDPARIPYGIARDATAPQAFVTREALDAIARTTVVNLRAFASGGLFVEGSSLT